MRLKTIDLSRCRIICQDLDELISVTKGLYSFLDNNGYTIVLIRTNYGEAGKYLKQFGGIHILFKKTDTNNHATIDEKIITEIQIYTRNMSSIMDMYDPRNTGDQHTGSDALFQETLLAEAHRRDLKEFLKSQGKGVGIQKMKQLGGDFD